MGFWTSLWTLLRPVAREAAADAANALIQKKLGSKTGTAGKSGKP